MTRWPILLVSSVVFFTVFALPQEASSTLHLKDISIPASYDIEEHNGQMIKIVDRLTGVSRWFKTRIPTYSLKNAAVNIQIIDLTTTDTTMFQNVYTRDQMFPFGGIGGRPFLITDYNQNGLPDIAASYKIEQSPGLVDVIIAEFVSDSQFVIQKIFDDSTTLALANTDLDNNGLQELNMLRLGRRIQNVRQTDPTGFPDSLDFEYRSWLFDGQTPSEATFLEMDGDSLLDLVHIGTDSSSLCCYQLIVAEYDTLTNNFVKRFGFVPQPEWRIAGISVGDFDGDGMMEFTTGSLDSDFHVIENLGNDVYSPVFQDTISTANAYLTTETNDIDGNGRIEFFVGGSVIFNNTISTRVYWIEASGDNQYEKVRSFFLVGTSVFGLAELSAYDVNNDGVEDLVFMFPRSVIILIWNRSSQKFDLHYYDEWEASGQQIRGITLFANSANELPALYVSLLEDVQEPIVRSYRFRSAPPTGIGAAQFPSKAIRHQNYPNPFNGQTTIRFSLQQRSIIYLSIFDVLGNEVNQLISNEAYAPGLHNTLWKGNTQTGKELSSGVYFYVLQAGSPDNKNGPIRKEVGKLIFLK